MNDEESKIFELENKLRMTEEYNNNIRQSNRDLAFEVNLLRDLLGKVLKVDMGTSGDIF